MKGIDFGLPIHEDKTNSGTWIVDVPKDKCKIIPQSERYTYKDEQIEIRLVDAYHKIVLDKNYKPISFNKLSFTQKRNFQEYLHERIKEGSNIGSRWVFFRSKYQKQPVIIYGPNVVFGDIDEGSDQINKFFAQMSFERKRKLRLAFLLAVLLMTIGGAIIWKMRSPEVAQIIKRTIPTVGGDSKAMEFYKKVFPDVYEWRNQADQPRKEIAEDILRPEYIESLLKHTQQVFWKTTSQNVSTENKMIRFILFDFFNYNEELKTKWEKYKSTIEKTTFGDLYKKYSIANSNLPNTIVYYKVGDINLEQIDIDNYLAKNYIDSGYKKIEEQEIFRDLPIEGTVKEQLRI